MRTALLLLPTLALLGAATATAQSLVKDINALPPTSNPSSSPADLFVFGAHAYFAATDGEHGIELWRTDGTTAGTSMLLDINPGTSSSSPSDFAVLAGKLYFSALSAPEGRELWVTDGTAAGTMLVADINPGTVSSSPANLVTFGSAIYFAATTGTTAPGTGVELWKSDGTAAGTVQVADVNVGTASSSPANLVVVGSQLFFTATTGTTAPGTGVELYVTDGTTAGTQLVLDINPGTTSSSPTEMVAFAGTLFFSALSAAGGRELWTSDGTALGTTQFLDLNAGTASATPTNLTVAGATLFFAASNGTSAPGTGTELWTTDGTVAGTVQVADINVGTVSSSPTNFLWNGTTLYFSALTAAGGRELWASDGTTVGTVQVADINAGTASSSPANLTALGTSIVFSASDGTTAPGGGTEVWVSDGTAVGTIRLADIQPGTSSSSPTNFLRLGSRVLFTALESTTPPGTGRELWATDGTPAGTALVLDINPADASSSSPSGFTAYGDHVYFSANDGVNGAELWRTDGTSAGTVLVADINPGSVSSSPLNLTVHQGKLYFTAITAAAGRELWVTDGTAAGTMMLADIQAGTSSSSPANLTSFGNVLLFSAAEGTTAPAAGTELWKTDGTVAGTVLVADINAGTSSSSPTSFVVFAGKVFFSALESTTSGRELWTTDGTTAGTTLFLDLNPGTTSSSPSNLVTMGNTLFFTASDGTTAPGSGTELWKTDGTVAGTVLVADINVGTASSSPTNLTVADGLLYFTALTTPLGRELYVTDGTTAGTILLADINVGTGSSTPTSMVAFGSTLLFRATQPATGYELWRSDGTPAGTAMVTEVGPGAFSGVAGVIAEAGANVRAIFPANDTNSGLDLWKTDGTAAGTSLLLDIRPGSASSSPANFVRIGNTVWFSANDGVNGIELWSMKLGVVGGSIAEPFGVGCAGTGGLVPVLSGVGLPLIGNASFAARVTQAAPSSASALFAHAVRAETVLGGGCTFYLELPVIVAVATMTDGAGTAQIPVPVPNNPAFVGREVFFQWAVADTAGSYLGIASFSQGLHLVVGN